MTRLRSDELISAWVDTPDAPMQIALLGIFDGGPFRQEDGVVDVARIRDELAARARRVAPLGRRVVWTRAGEGRPVWAPDPAFDPAAHIETATVPAGTDLATWAANRIARPLDRQRPLWRAEVADGLPDGQFAVIIVVSHILADGRAGVALAGALLDPRPDTHPPAPPVAAVPPLPSRRELVPERARELRGSVRRIRRPAPGSSARRRRGLRQFRDVLAALRTPVPATSLPRRIGSGRRLAIVRRPLEELQRAGHVLGVTVNDLLLVAVCDGLRELLTARGENGSGLVVRATVPVVTGWQEQQVTSMIFVDLPVGEPDPMRRLALIHRTTTAGKARLHAEEGNVTDIPLPTAVARLAVRWGRRLGSRSITLAVADVTGPPAPLWLAGARMLAAVPVAPLASLVPLSVAGLSYAGELAVSVHADAAVTDLDRLAAGMARSFTLFPDLARAGSRPATPATSHGDPR